MNDYFIIDDLTGEILCISNDFDFICDVAFSLTYSGSFVSVFCGSDYIEASY